MDLLTKKAIDAIKRLFSDRSVPKGVTLERLLEVKEVLDMRVELLEDDMEHWED